MMSPSPRFSQNQATTRRPCSPTAQTKAVTEEMSAKTLSTACSDVPKCCAICRMAGTKTGRACMAERSCRLLQTWDSLSREQKGCVWSQISKASVLNVLRSKPGQVCAECRTISKTFFKSAGAILRFLSTLETDRECKTTDQLSLEGYCEDTKFIFTGVPLGLNKKVLSGRWCPQ